MSSVMAFLLVDSDLNWEARTNDRAALLVFSKSKVAGLVIIAAVNIVSGQTGRA